MNFDKNAAVRLHLDEYEKKSEFILRTDGEGAKQSRDNPAPTANHPFAGKGRFGEEF